MWWSTNTICMCYTSPRLLPPCLHVCVQQWWGLQKREVTVHGQLQQWMQQKPDANVNILGSHVAVFGSPGTIICIIPSSQVLLIQSPSNGIHTPLNKRKQHQTKTITDELSYIGKNKERTNNQGCPCPDRG